jgi:nucleotide-binding universal stress UspA family protein
MYDTILFPTDGSEPAGSTLEYALDVAAEHDATLHVLNVADVGRGSVVPVRDDALDALEREGRRIVDEAADRAAKRGIPVQGVVRRGDPSETIVAYATEADVDCIVMPTHGRRGVQRFLLGSVTERVINTADVPVVAVNPDRGRTHTYPCRELLVPTDGSRGAELAMTNGIAVARATGATLHVLHVVETGGLGPDARSVIRERDLTERGHEVVTAAVERAESASVGSVTGTVEHGDPAAAIRTYIDDNEVGLAVLGTHGRTDFSRYVMGGVSAKLVRTSPVPVMWVRDPGSDGDAPPGTGTRRNG